jgi:hypothetical protein
MDAQSSSPMFNPIVIKNSLPASSEGNSGMAFEDDAHIEDLLS